MGWLPQIPARLLPDDAVVRIPGGDGFADGVALKHVRFDRMQSVSDDGHRSADAGAGTVFVDAVNTDGAFEVPAGSRIDIEGRSYLVAEAKRFEGHHGRVHHWELVVR